jgi:hypothetical protein
MMAWGTYHCLLRDPDQSHRKGFSVPESHPNFTVRRQLVIEDGSREVLRQSRPCHVERVEDLVLLEGVITRSEDLVDDLLGR